MRRIENCGLRVAIVATDDDELLGIATDGDLRRAILDGIKLDTAISAVMNDSPVTAQPENSRKEIEKLMRENYIQQVPVVDSKGNIVALETIDTLMSPKMRSVPVVIMAGGLGTRLRPLTNDRPKPLVEVEGIPILGTLVERLSVQGFTNIYLSVNYKAEMIKERFGDGSEWGVQIDYLCEDKPLGTAGPLSLLPDVPTEPLLVVNGDLLTTVDFAHFVDYHQDHSVGATIGVRRQHTQIPYGVVEIENHKVMSIEEKPTQTYFVNAGIYVLEKDILSFIPNNKRIDMTDVLQKVIDNKIEVTAYPIQEYWQDVGKREDLEQAKANFGKVFGQ
jgi:dTDP-glucose pyrophosphorylase